jgi:hypothetical protein
LIIYSFKSLKKSYVLIISFFLLKRINSLITIIISFFKISTCLQLWLLLNWWNLSFIKFHIIWLFLNYIFQKLIWFKRIHSSLLWSVVWNIHRFHLSINHRISIIIILLLKIWSICIIPWSNIHIIICIIVLRRGLDITLDISIIVTINIHFLKFLIDVLRRFIKIGLSSTNWLNIITIIFKLTSCFIFSHSKLNFRITINPEWMDFV